jgi:hypothetical protein
MTLESLIFPIRFLTLLTVGVLCWAEPFCLPLNSVGGLMAVLAQGHFLLGYWYQYKTGKIDRSYAARYLPIAGLLFAACLLTSVDKLLEILAAAYFLIHFFYDERYLLREDADFFGWRIAMPTIGLLAAEIIYRFTHFHSSWFILSAFILGATYLIWLIISEIVIMRRFSSRSLYFSGIFAVASLLVLSGKVLPGPVNLNAVTFIILMHIANWYWRYITKFATSRVLLGRFVAGVIAVNMIMGILMFFRFHSSYSPFLTGFGEVFFQHPNFYVWSILHFVATYRSGDAMNWIPIKTNQMALR